MVIDIKIGTLFHLLLTFLATGIFFFTDNFLITSSR